MTALAPQDCPVCGATWPRPSPRCFCGYDFETRDPDGAIRRLSADRRRASRTVGIGLGVIGLAVATVGLSVVYEAYLLRAVLLGLIQLGVGAGLTLRGLIAHYRSANQLAAAKALRQLPPARVVR